MRKGSFVLRSAAVADHSTRAAVGTAYTVPAGYGGHIYKVEAIAYTEAQDTAVPNGGLIELENGSVDWKPFKFYLNSQQLLTTTGAEYRKVHIDCDLPLPENSVVTAYYTALNAATDVVMIQCYYEVGRGVTAQTFMDIANSSALTNAYTTSAKACTFTAVPSTKGGKLKKVFTLWRGTPETALSEGGLAEFYSNAWTGPYIQVISSSMTGKTTMSGEHLWEGNECDVDLGDNAIMYVDATPVDNQSTVLYAGIMWTRK